VPLLNLIINEAGDAGVQDVVMGMAHRGRLNVLINIMGKSASSLFRAFADQDSEHYLGRGDVKYHLGYTNAVTSPKGNKVALSLCFNPSHLEFVAPVVAGRTRAITDSRGAGSGLTALPISIHGDAAFIGQGIVIETLNLAGLEGYKTSGTIRLVLNNQVGFTTAPAIRGRPATAPTR
jgi:2-oxoglutarate dehydrogenase E1 component